MMPVVYWIRSESEESLGLAIVKFSDSDLSRASVVLVVLLVSCTSRTLCTFSIKRSYNVILPLTIGSIHLVKLDPVPRLCLVTYLGCTSGLILHSQIAKKRKKDEKIEKKKSY